ncbi:hypothetical protein NPIL_219671, partial [Nephila pilipes]
KLSSTLENRPDTSFLKPKIMGQNLKELRFVPTSLHLCPGTAECCKKNDGKWDYCPKAVVPYNTSLEI